MSKDFIFSDCQAVQVVVTPADLREFALAIVAEIKQANDRNDEKLYTPDEFAKRHNVTKPTLWRWAKLGILHPVKVGRKVYYRDSDLMKKEG